MLRDFLRLSWHFIRHQDQCGGGHRVVGLVGNSGNSTEPHLHFHISNATSPLGGEGLPYALTSFEVQAHTRTQDAEINVGQDGKLVAEMQSLPTDGEVVRFPATP